MAQVHKKTNVMLVSITTFFYLSTLHDSMSVEGKSLPHEKLYSEMKSTVVF